MGRLVLAEDGSVRASVRSAATPAKSISAVQAVVALQGGPFLQSSGFQQDADGLALSWPAGCRTGLPAIAAGWRKSPASAIAEALNLARIVGQAASELDHLGPQRFLLSPAQVFLCRDEAGRDCWGIATLPVQGATLADFASTSPDLLAWLSADEVLERAAIDRAYLTGAALYYCLIGDLFPEGLSQSERIRRLLMYRAGNPTRAKAVLSAALPKSLAGLGQRLADLMASVLVPALGRTLTAARVALELELLEGELTAPVLASAWESEGNVHFAAEILNAFARRVPEAEVHWGALARLRARTGDAAGAAEAAARVEPEPDEGVTYIQHIRAIAARGPEGRAELEQVVSRLQGASVPPLTDEEFLFLVYAKGRWLGDASGALGLLSRDFEASWHQLIRAILTARFSAECGAWGDVLRQCREGRRMIDGLPDRGSAAGRYAFAYLDLLDGVAHVRAVELGTSEAYLEDALIKFENAWIALREFAPDELHTVTAGWLTALMRTIAGKPGLDLLRLGAEAFCHSVGIDPSRADNAFPKVPWASDERIFGS